MTYVNRGEHKLRAITAAIKRLKASDTPRKRANALKAFADAVKELESSVVACFPKLRADGTAIIRRKARGARCPFCRVPMKSFVMLAEHLHTKHDAVADRRCVCGKQYATWTKPYNKARTALARHLAGVGDLRVHLAEAVMAKAAGLV